MRRGSGTDVDRFNELSKSITSDKKHGVHGLGRATLEGLYNVE